MGQIANRFPDLRFRKEQLIFTDAQLKEVAADFWPGPPPAGALTDIDRAFIQAMLMVAVSKSEQAGFFFFYMFKSFMTSAPSRSVIKLARSMAASRLRSEFRKYIDDDPKYSAVGKAAMQYSIIGSTWRHRVQLNDPGFLDDFRATPF